MSPKPVFIRTRGSSTLAAAGAELRLGDGLFARGVAAPDRASELAVLAIDGSGIFNGKFVASRDDAVAAVAGLTVDDLAEAGGAIRGSLTLFVFAPRLEQVFVMADPLGSGLTFYADDGPVSVVSPYVEAAASAFEHLGGSAPKALAYALSQIATGMLGGVVESSYENLHALPVGAYAVIDGRGFSIVEYAPNRDAATLNWDEAIERARTEIIQNVETAIAHESERRVAHLTGGMDSRLVLGGLLAAGSLDEVAFNTRGDADNPDKVVARGLATVFGLRTTTYLGLNEAVPPQSREEYLLGPLRLSGGIVAPPAHENMFGSDTLTLAGGYGEYYRSFSRERDFIARPVTAFEGASARWGSYGFNVDPQERLFQEPVVERFLEPIKASMDFAREQDLAPDTWLDVFYRRYRNRYFIGEISRAWSRHAPRFDPLYSRFVNDFLLRQAFDVRVAGLFQFDLLRSFDARLATLPFDTPRHTPLYERLRGAPEVSAFPADSSGGTELDWTNRPPLRSGQPYSPATEVTSRDRALASRQGITAVEAAEIRIAREAMPRYRESLKKTQVDAIVRTEVLEKIADRASRHTWSRRALMSAERGFLWASE